MCVLRLIIIIIIGHTHPTHTHTLKRNAVTAVVLFNGMLQDKQPNRWGGIVNAMFFPDHVR